MLSEPRSIAFILDCMHPPVRHEQKTLQQFFADQSSDADLGYQNFATNALGAQLTTVHGPTDLPGSTAHSLLAFGADRFQVKEEWPRISLDHFVSRARKAAELAMGSFAIPMITGIQCVVRALASVQGYPDSRSFLDEAFLGFETEDRELFGKDPGLLGFRLMFPAQGGDTGVHNVRIESFQADPRSVFLEEMGAWPGPVRSDNLDPLEDAIRQAYEFVTDNVIAYLDRRSHETDGL